MEAVCSSETWVSTAGLHAITSPNTNTDIFAALTTPSVISLHKYFVSRTASLKQNGGGQKCGLLAELHIKLKRLLRS
jgi:hypothetical protein